MKTSEYNAAVYDKLASFYAGHEYWRSDEEHAIGRYFPNSKGKLLVGGVGGGRVMSHLNKFGFEITAVDISPGMVEECRRKGIRAQVMDIQHTTFADGEFDYIFLPFHTICYVDSQKETLTELKRILRPAGTLVFSAPNQFFLKDALAGGFFKSIRRPVLVARGSTDTVMSRQFSYFDRWWMHRIFSRVIVQGRASLQQIERPNWKDRLLAHLPFFDKSLYFVCVK